MEKIEENDRPITFALLAEVRGIRTSESPRGLWPLQGEPLIVLRPCGDIDFPVLKRIHRQAMEESVVRSVGAWDEEVQLERLKKHFDATTLWGISLDGVTRGFVRLVAEGDLLIEQFYLEPAFQGRGLGQRVLEAVLGVAGQAGVEVALQVLKGSRARGLYERVGFVKIGEDAYQDHLKREAVSR